ncbi:MAG: hypothetical protein ACFFDK_07525, partial [Promethearchaeota archaeon]
YKTNEKRLDYFWVFITGTIIWSAVELSLQLTGGRVLQEKYLFGLVVTDWLWFTIPVQAMCEAGTIGVMGTYFGDRIINKKTRKKNIFIFALILAIVTLSFLSSGISYSDVDVGGDVPSRREMWTIGGFIAQAIIIFPTIYWLGTTDSKSRKRGLYMILVMLVWATVWNIGQWLIGERWIEVGIQNSDGSYSNLQRADPMLEFWAMVYDTIFEITLVYSPFLAIPYLLGLIKSEEIVVNNKV